MTQTEIKLNKYLKQIIKFIKTVIDTILVLHH